MEWADILIYVIKYLCGFIVIFGIPSLVKYFSSKVANEQDARLIAQVGDLVSKCVIMIDQTYVDILKECGSFDKESQKKAFQMCMTRIMSMLSNDAEEAIKRNFGDVEEYLEVQIEANVRNESVVFCNLETDDLGLQED